jgi:hypothetical protein
VFYPLSCLEEVLIVDLHDKTLASTHDRNRNINVHFCYITGDRRQEPPADEASGARQENSISVVQESRDSVGDAGQSLSWQVTTELHAFKS